MKETVLKFQSILLLRQKDDVDLSVVLSENDIEKFIVSLLLLREKMTDKLSILDIKTGMWLIIERHKEFDTKKFRRSKYKHKLPSILNRKNNYWYFEATLQALNNIIYKYLQCVAKEPDYKTFTLELECEARNYLYLAMQ
jgi:hypothetical protein